MNHLIPDFTKASVLVIGDVMLDRYWFGDAARISPEAPVPVVNVKQMDDRPGGAGNVALNIASLGAQATIIGVAGHDEAGRILNEQLLAAHVKTAIQYFDKTPTVTKLRVLSRNQQLIRLDFEEKFLNFDTTLLLHAFESHLPHCNLVILSDYNKGTLCCLPELIQLARQARVPVLADPKGNNFKIYRHANIITPNLKEFETIVGTCHSDQEIVNKGRALLEELHIETLLLTRGDRGMSLISNTAEAIHLPAHAREVFDVTGAGDTVIATAGTALAAGATLPEAMQLANLAASLVVAKLGAATISAPELQAAYSGSLNATAGIMDEEQLLLAINAARIQGKKIVFTNGCFDILHAGHVTFLQQAKQLGDYLIVAINDDDSIKRLNKGPGRPINDINQRMAVIAGLGVVDWVVPFADDTPERLLKKLQPDILVKGGEYTLDQVVGASIVTAYGGMIRILGTKINSTTEIINRVLESYQLTEPQGI